MRKRIEKRRLYVDIPTELYNVYAKICIDLGISKTEGIIRYFNYLKMQHVRKRQMAILKGNSKHAFNLDDQQLG